MLSTILLSFATLMSGNLFASIDTLMEKAKTPDFLQMHTGDLDYERLENFSKQHANVEDFQALEYLNISGDDIAIGNGDLANTVQDLGLVYQSDRFDYLLDAKNQIIHVNPGEVYLPLLFYEKDGAELNTTVKIHGQSFQLKGFFRDSQMNASLAGSKRILLHRADFEKLRAYGTSEYLIEFLLKDRTALSEFEKDYYEHIPEKNGPKITYSMFRLINGITDGLLIAVLLLASFLILIIAFLCIRLILLAKIEDEYREIGLLKAIGIRAKDIKRQYLLTFILLSLPGIFLGSGIAFFTRDKVLENIYLYMGQAIDPVISVFFNFLAVSLLFIVIVVYIDGILNKINKISPVQALRDGESTLDRGSRRNLPLAHLGFISPTLALACSGLYARKKQYFTLFLVIVLATFLMIMPQNINHTFQDPTFITNMGIGQMDLRFETSEELSSSEEKDTLMETLKNDDALSKFTLIRTKDIPVSLPDGEKTYLRTSFGDHEAFPIRYSKGHSPKSKNQIALSTLYLNDLNLSVGETIYSDFGEKLHIVGEYSDISNGGKTAKAIFPIDSENTKSTYYLSLKDKENLDDLIERYRLNFPELKVIDVNDYLDQSMGPVIRQMNRLSSGLIVSGLFVVFLITLLFAKLLFIKEQSQTAILKSIGFTDRDLSVQFIARFLIVLLLGIPLGIGLSNTLGSLFARLILYNFGAHAIPFVIRPLATYLLIPSSIAIATFISARLALLDLAKINVANWIKE